MKRNKKLICFTVCGVVVTLAFAGVLALATLFPSSQASYTHLFDTYAAWVAGCVATLFGMHTWMDWKCVQQGITEISNEVTSVTKEIRFDPKDFDVPLDQLHE